jgi:hypothetical protein
VPRDRRNSYDGAISKTSLSRTLFVLYLCLSSGHKVSEVSRAGMAYVDASKGERAACDAHLSILEELFTKFLPCHSTDKRIRNIIGQRMNWRDQKPNAARAANVEMFDISRISASLGLPRDKRSRCRAGEWDALRFVASTRFSARETLFIAQICRRVIAQSQRARSGS